MADPYLLPNDTLRNRLGIGDPRKFEAAETYAVGIRLSLIATDGPKGAFTFDRLKATHRFLFQEVYDWAGETRKVNLAKGEYATGPKVPFVRADSIEAVGAMIFTRLAEAQEFRNLERAAFVDRLTSFFADLNLLHPFREGNGRTQEAFAAALARDAGHPLDFSAITRERMISVSIGAARSSNQVPMRQMFTEAADPRLSTILRGAIESIRSAVPDWNDRFSSITTAGQKYNGVLVGVARGAETFMFRDEGAIHVGWRRDLPPGATPGGSISFTAGTIPDLVVAPAPTQTSPAVSRDLERGPGYKR